ncbi:hypothetical protein ONZ51_g3630 [Trametes cubensis]|uniref:Uncharacterized protein n=1 Tax=Trametes cubensis TaxID=1111947 RepID=A0AAD7TZU5_9APHY|nr:hypothetical protein ONZ51_g3630 [Trametes cubensis]
MSAIHAPKPVRPVGRPCILDTVPPSKSRVNVRQPLRARYDRILATHQGVVSLTAAANMLYQLEDYGPVCQQALTPEAWWTAAPRGRPRYTRRNASSRVSIVKSSGSTIQTGMDDRVAMPFPLPAELDGCARSPQMGSSVAAVPRPAFIRRAASFSVAKTPNALNASSKDGKPFRLFDNSNEITIPVQTDLIAAVHSAFSIM